MADIAFCGGTFHGWRVAAALHNRADLTHDGVSLEITATTSQQCFGV